MKKKKDEAAISRNVVRLSVVTIRLFWTVLGGIQPSSVEYRRKPGRRKFLRLDSTRFDARFSVVNDRLERNHTSGKFSLKHIIICTAELVETK